MKDLFSCLHPHRWVQFSFSVCDATWDCRRVIGKRFGKQTEAIPGWMIDGTMVNGDWDMRKFDFMMFLCVLWLRVLCVCFSAERICRGSLWT